MPQKILIVDDDVQTLRLVGLVLDRHGYDVVVAQSGKQALEKARTGTPHLVILDIMMPGIDGYDVCRRLRASPDTADLPILLFTGKAQEQDKVTGFEAGADDYLSKPIRPDELVSRVQALLTRSSRAQVEEGPTAKSIAFLGSKGGMGTTTLVVNAAVALAQGKAKDQQVMLAELHDGIATAGFQLGFRQRGGITEIIPHPMASINGALVEDQLYRHRSGLLVLSGQSKPPGVGQPLSPDHAQVIVEHLGTLADYLLLDLGIGLGEVNKRILPRCRHVVVTFEPNDLSLTLARALLEEMNQSLNIPGQKVSLISINRSNSATSVTKDAIEEMLGHKLAGAVPPASELAFQSTTEKKPIVIIDPDGLAAQQYKTIAENLIDAVRPSASASEPSRVSSHHR